MVDPINMTRAGDLRASLSVVNAMSAVRALHAGTYSVSSNSCEGFNNSIGWFIRISAHRMAWRLDKFTCHSQIYLPHRNPESPCSTPALDNDGLDINFSARRHVAHACGSRSFLGAVADQWSINHVTILEG